jgi:hypothetical protein
MRMLRVIFYSATSNPVRYGYNQLINHLGMPFEEINSFENLQNCSNDVLVIPETSQMVRMENVVCALNRFCAVVMIGDMANCFQNAEDYQVVHPPKVSGFLDFGKFEHVPFFYEFPTLRAEKDTEVLGKIRSQTGISTGVLWCEKQDKIYVLIAPQIFKTISYFLASVLSPLKEFKEKENRLHSKLTYARIPVVNVLEQIFLQIMIRIARKKNVPLVHKWFYPSAKKTAICLTHDVDSLYRYSPIFAKLAIQNMRLGRYSEARNLALLSISSLFFKRVFFSSIPKPLESVLTAKSSIRYDFLDNVLSLVEIERKLNGTSSFFFLSSSSPKDSNYDFDDPKLRKLVRFLYKNGWEVGLHGSYYSHSYKVIAEEKSCLENSLGHRIYGIRQHYLRLWVPESWRYQSKVGLAYDTSLGYNHTQGFKAGCCLPFQAYDIKNETLLPLLEIPLILQDLSLSQHGKRIDPKEAVEICRKTSKIIYEVNGVFTLNWHVDYDERTSPGWNMSYMKVLQDLSRRDAWLIDGFNLAKWWKSRSQVGFENIRWQNTALTFEIHSDTEVRAFTLRIFPPRGEAISNITANGARICEEETKHEEGFTLVSFNLEQGINRINIEMN